MGKVAYNEIDPYAVDYMRWLMVDGMIAPGHIFECSIEDLTPRDLQGFDQFHAFAGMGVWSYALRRIGWPDHRRIWTGSCPCQPFSASGKGAGFADKRHLWPAFFHLIAACRPVRIVGEQVADQNGLAWLDLVSSDLESCDYAARAVPLCSAGFGSPDVRNRLYWVGDAFGEPGQRDPGGVLGAQAEVHRTREQDGRGPHGFSATGAACGLADTHHAQRGSSPAGGHDGDREGAGRSQGPGHAKGRGPTGGLADAHGGGRQHELRERPASVRGGSIGAGEALQQPSPDGPGVGERPGPLNGFWRNADWLFCRDGKWRPVEPGTFPLVDGSPSRVGRLRTAGNAINAQVAIEFLRALDD